MSNNAPAGWAGVIIRMASGTTHLLEFVNPTVNFNFSQEPREVPPSDASMFREFTAGPMSGMVSLSGYVSSNGQVRAARPDWADVTALVSTGEPAGKKAKLRKAMRAELVALWSDMTLARASAYNGCWSGRCVNLAERIVRLSRLAGPTHWKNVDVAVLREGVYERVYDEAGITYEPVDHGGVNEIHDRAQCDARAMP